MKKIMTDNACQLVQTITSTAIDGCGPMKGAGKLASEYMRKSSNEDIETKVDSLIRWQTANNAGSGFVTSLGGAITLPVTIPASIVSSLLLQARLVAAIAIMYGYDIHDEKVKTMVMLTLLGGSAQSVLRESGVKVTNRLLLNGIKKIPGEVIMKINKKIGMRLITKAGEKGVINLTKMVPLIGGFVGGSFDGYCCYQIGRTAKKVFRECA